MPRGQILNIPNGTAVTTTTLSREEKASLAMLNPNDGILYVKENGPASNTPTMWDWKVPSQSYCQLPGPWQSLGVYYQDQSGGGAAAQVNVYESDSEIAIPSFIAIGRAIQTAGTTMDISTGSQPQNPPANTARLWADGNGDLHILSANGTDNIIYDSSNIGNVALGGDLFGTISLAHINVKYGDSLQFTYSDSTIQRVLQPVNRDSYLFTGPSTMLYFYADSPGPGVLGNWSGNPNTLTLNGTLNVIGANRSGGWINCNNYPVLSWDGATSHIYNGLTIDNGVLLLNAGAPNSPGAYIALTQRVGTQICLYDGGSGNCYGLGINSNELSLITAGTIIGFRYQNNSGPRNIYFDVSAGNSYVNVSYANQVQNAGAYYTSTSGYVFICGSANNALYWNLSNAMQLSSSGNPALWRFYAPDMGGSAYCDLQMYNFTPVSITQFGFQIAQSGNPAPVQARAFVPSGMVGGWVTASNRSGASSNEVGVIAHCYVPGSVWCTNVQSLSDRRLKQALNVLDPIKALGLVLDKRVNAYSYKWLDPVEGSSPASEESFGFMADEMVEVCPEVVELSTVDGKTDPSAIVYTQLVAVLWAAVRGLNDRIEQLELAA